ncbi:MAG: transcription elongation factor subunit Spt4 [Candidatus Thorarchaeota archaeon]
MEKPRRTRRRRNNWVGIKIAKLKACKACHYLTNESMCPNCKGTNLSTSYTGIVVILPGRVKNEDPRKSSYVASRLNIDKPGKYALKVR